jgi:quinol monooxygenase YgiN
MVKFGLVVRLVAKSGKEEELAKFLSGAEPLARAETFTPLWFALRSGPNVFYIVDAFATDADRGKHLSGEIAKALMAKADVLLSEPPKIENVDVLAAKSG